MIKFMILFFLALTAQAQTPPMRVISLSPAITEILYELKLEKFLIATSDHSDYPKAALKLPSVGAYSKPQMEKILSLKPDLVFIPAEGSEENKIKLDKLKIKSFTIDIHKLKDIGQAAADMAEALGESAKGLEFKKNWEARLLKIKTPQNTKGSFILAVQTEPFMAAGKNTFLDEALGLCGGENYYSKEKGYFRPSNESLFSPSLRAVLLVEHFDSEASQNEALQIWKKRIKKTNSEKKIIPINPDLAARPGPRLIEGIKEICRAMAH